MKTLYRIYQLFIALPIGILATIFLAVIMAVGSTTHSTHIWSYYPGRWWARIVLWLLLIPVQVEGRGLLDEKQSYVFVANHQGLFDVFLIYGYLGRNFKWMMKQSLRRLPFVGFACEKSGQIFVDRSGPKAIKSTYDKARQTLKGGTSLTVFPEGARTFDGTLQPFKRGAFALADELQLPVVPMTIMPRTRDGHFAVWHPLTLTIHKPIAPQGKGADNITATMALAEKAIRQALEE